MRKTKGEKVFYLINYVLLSLVAVSCILPLLNIVALSFSDARAVVSGQVGLWPVDFTWFSYHSLITGTPILNAFWNSVEITLIGTGLSMAVTIMAAYPLSRRHFYHRRFFTMAMVFTMIFNGGLIPTYLVVQNLGLVNSYGALWLPGLVSTYNMLIMRSYFENLPGKWTRLRASMVVVNWGFCSESCCHYPNLCWRLLLSFTAWVTGIRS